MNSDLFWAYIALAAVSKLLTMKRPTPGEKLAVLLVTVAMALLVARFVPQEMNTAVIPVIAFFFGGDVAGDWLGVGFDKLRVLRASRTWLAKLKGTNGNATKR